MKSQLAFRVDDDLQTRIETAAGMKRGAVSELLRAAVTEHLARIAGADLETNPANVSFLVGSIFGATATIAARSAGELADLTAAFRAAGNQSALGADDRAALSHASNFLDGSAAALRGLADRFRFSPDCSKRVQ